MKKILGLDLGTNSIGWAVINAENDKNKLTPLSIQSVGSRIIPMDAATLGDFDKGNSISQTAERTRLRGIRRLIERGLLRRERLHRVLDKLGFLPSHYADQLTRYGKFLADSEPKLAWKHISKYNNEFLFMDSFHEMLNDFNINHPQLLAGNRKVPYDWTIYYLRKKALTQKIAKEELAWILLNFNQKRGYYQLRGEEDDLSSNKLVEFYALKVISVEDSGDRKGKDIWYNVHLENGWIYKRPSNVKLDWVGKTKEFIVTTDLESNGLPKKDKEGNIKRSFRAPKEDDWTLIKKKTEQDICQTDKTVGEYIYDSLLNDPTQKIKGKLVRTIERKFYKEELISILNKQKEFHEELRDKELYQECVKELYANNVAHRNNIINRDLAYLFVEDIIFYQRPLKSKKSLIDNCSYELNTGIDKETGEIKQYPLKGIAKSNPIFQEFRLWQFLYNLKVYQREKDVNGKFETDVDVTNQFIKNQNDVENLFDWLNERKEITQDVLLGSYFKIKKPKGKDYPYRWNYVEDKKYPCNETHAMILSFLSKADINHDFLSAKVEAELWHILYSVEDKQEISKALKRFALKNNLDEKFVGIFSKFPPFKKEYGAYSAKAIKKLLALMRIGRYWNEDAIDNKTKERIQNFIINGFNDKLQKRLGYHNFQFTSLADFRGLPLWLACYVVYDRHSETKDICKWEKPEDIDIFLNTFKQHSLRNPIVEQVVRETLRTVCDIWKQEGQIDEIHIELGREMKNPADKRRSMTMNTLNNENTNLRIKALLTEFMNPEYNIDGVRPYSMNQQTLLRIYEEDVLNNTTELPEDIDVILKKFNEIDSKKRPSNGDIMRYKLWLEQKYRSPYTGNIIPLGKLFTPMYEIEHIIPRSRYFDDSLSNKVICESEVNKLKDNQLGYEFILNHSNQIIVEGVKIFTVEEYEQFVKDHFSRNNTKKKKLLMNDIPDDFIDRQLNDSRYISKLIKSLLSNIVREKDGDNYESEAISKNIITCNGAITDQLKKDWGMNDVWNRIILPRFERLNKICDTDQFTTQNTHKHLIPNMPLDLQKGFNKKRIDHRHHAMDAIVIACTTRNHVNLLNNEAAKSTNKSNRYSLSQLLRRYEKTVITNAKGERKEINVAKEFIKPWESFTYDAYTALESVIVSFKQNLRVVSKTTNIYCHYKDGEKKRTKQISSDSWSIRKPMHKDTVFGEVNLRKIKSVSLKEAIIKPDMIVDKVLKAKIKELLNINYDFKQIKQYFDAHLEEWPGNMITKIEIYYFTNDTKDRYFAVRKNLDTSFNLKTIESSVTDTGIQKILIRHLELNDNNPMLAFSSDGIDQMNHNIIELNNGKYHKPIIKVRLYEKADKYAIGQSGNKKAKFVEAAKGTNLFFAVYENTIENNGVKLKKRSFNTIPLNIVIERVKKGLTPAPENENGIAPLFVLSPNDLVYLPTEQELENGIRFNTIDRDRIYKMVSATGNRAFFIKYYVASSIIDKVEFSPLNKMERAITDEMIKEICIPIKVDRLGNILQL